MKTTVFWKKKQRVYRYRYLFQSTIRTRYLNRIPEIWREVRTCIETTCSSVNPGAEVVPCMTGTYASSELKRDQTLKLDALFFFLFVNFYRRREYHSVLLASFYVSRSGEFSDSQEQMEAGSENGRVSLGESGSLFSGQSCWEFLRAAF